MARARGKIYPNRLTTYVTDEVWAVIKSRLEDYDSEAAVLRDIIEEWISYGNEDQL